MANSAFARARAACSSRPSQRSASLVAAAFGLLAALTSAEALAQTDKEKAASDKLYQEGLSKMLEGKLDVGCPKLAESQRLFPRPGTLFTLAECEAKAGRFATAVERYKEYLKMFADMDPAQQSKQREKQRDKISATQIDALTSQAPRLTITVVGDASPVAVKLDGAPLSADRLGTEILVDPGEHVVAAEGGAKGPFEKKLTLAKGATERVEIQGAKAAKHEEVVAPKPSAGPSGRRIAALVLGGVGVASAAVGAITGGLALGQKGTVTSHCKDTRKNDVWSCDAVGIKAADSGQTFALVSSVTLGVGVGAAAAGVVLFLTEPSAKKKKSDDVSAARRLAPQVALGPSAGFLGVTGVW